MTVVCRAFVVASVLFFALKLVAAPQKPNSVVDLNPNVRVRLKTLATQSLEVIGSQLSIAGRALSQNSVHLEFSDGQWTAEIGNEKVVILQDSISLSGQSLYVEKVFVPPSIKLVARNQQVDVIANLPLESYLEGVVASEIPKSWPHEAQKAQAIAARTFTINKLKERAKSSFDVEATVMDQVFTYRKYESLTSSQKAVRETRGEFIANTIGIVEPIFYHASCGGATDGADKVFGQPVSKQARGNTVKDHCSLNTKTTWQFEISKSELIQKLQSALRLEKGSEILGLEPQQKTLGGRVLTLAFNTSNGSKSITGEALRSLVGYSRIKSTKFSVSKAGDNYIFSGKGLGHGVGLCQWGARDLALKGKSAREILGHYFPYLRVQSRSSALQTNSQVL